MFQGHPTDPHQTFYLVESCEHSANARLDATFVCETPEHAGPHEGTGRPTCQTTTSNRSRCQLNDDLGKLAVNLIPIPLHTRDVIITSPPRDHALSTPVVTLTNHVFVVGQAGPHLPFANLRAWTRVPSSCVALLATSLCPVSPRVVVRWVTGKRSALRKDFERGHHRATSPAEVERFTERQRHRKGARPKIEV